MTIHQDNTQDALRRGAHAMWAGVAHNWAHYADEVDAQSTHLTELMLTRCAPQDGERVLELACGPGGLGLAAAVRVGPHGEVVLSDVAAEMTAIAARRAATRGITNVRIATLDLEAIDQPDDSYDVALCREGLMFALAPERAVAEISRVLRPGGRVALAVWGQREHNPWLGLVFDAVSAQLGMPIPPPHVPGPFALSDAARFEEMLVAAGLEQVTIERVPVVFRAASFEAWLNRTIALAGPLATILSGIGDDAKVALAERLRSAMAPYLTSAGLEIPGVTLLASAIA
jgi:ubiquinone/menaquinone biosynthesis C-methylase UbiE